MSKFIARNIPRELTKTYFKKILNDYSRKNVGLVDNLTIVEICRSFKINHKNGRQFEAPTGSFIITVEDKEQAQSLILQSRSEGDGIIIKGYGCMDFKLKFEKPIVLFVGNLPKDKTREELYRAFSMILRGEKLEIYKFNLQCVP